MLSPRWGTALAAGWAALILALTLHPGSEIAARPEDIHSISCLLCGDRGGGDAILNVLLFLPLGVALMATTDKAWKMVAWIAMLSVVIEVMQGMIPGRYQTVGDVVYNVVGGSAGVGLSAVREQLLRPGQRMGGLLAGGTGALAAAIFLITGFMLAPSFPPTIYYGQWTADLGHLESYGGRVLDASLGSMFLGSEQVSNPELAVALHRSGAPLEVHAVAGPAPTALAPIVSIFDESETEILLLGADLTDLVLRVRYRANDFHLDRPDLRVRRALTGTQPGDTIRLRSEKTPEGYSLWIDQQEYAPLRHTPGEGWALLLHPEHTLQWVDYALNYAWVVGLLVLAGWWAPGLPWAAGSLALALSGMAMGAALGPLTHLAAPEVLAAFLGLTLGVLLRRAQSQGFHNAPLIC